VEVVVGEVVELKGVEKLEVPVSYTGESEGEWAVDDAVYIGILEKGSKYHSYSKYSGDAIAFLNMNISSRSGGLPYSLAKT